MLFDILDLCLVNLAFASKAGSSPATPTTKELFDIMELPYFDINLYNIIAYWYIFIYLCGTKFDFIWDVTKWQTF